MDVTSAIIEAVRHLTTRVSRLETLETGVRLTQGTLTAYDRASATATVEVGSVSYAGVRVAFSLACQPWCLQIPSTVGIAGFNSTTPANGIIVYTWAAGLPWNPMDPIHGHLHRGLEDGAPILP